MITEDYVSFEVAKLLKEKGFNEPTNRYYNAQYGMTRTVSDTFMTYWNDEDHMKVLMMEGALAIPTHQMAMKWLREKRIYFSLVPFIENVGWPKDTWHINFYNSDGIIGGGFPVEGYENAVEAALKYSLENLI